MENSKQNSSQSCYQTTYTIFFQNQQQLPVLQISMKQFSGRS